VSCGGAELRSRFATDMQMLRRIGALPWLLPLTALILRARTVRPALGFALREAVRVHDRRGYALAYNGLRIGIRHTTADAVTLGEVFHDFDYLPPESVPQLRTYRRILDLGANIGLFGAFAATYWPDARIEAYEPDPANAAVHRATIAANGLGARWNLTEAAAGDHDGELRFLAGQASLSRAADLHPGAGDSADTDAITVPVHDILAAVAEADLLKMDIEGGEWAILGDPRFRAAPPRVVVLEYHPHLCPGPDARATACDALHAAGMTVHDLKRGPAGHGMLWAWRT
jgi:FkbM family methyltransferase